MYRSHSDRTEIFSKLQTNEFECKKSGWKFCQIEGIGSATNVVSKESFDRLRMYRSHSDRTEIFSKFQTNEFECKKSGWKFCQIEGIGEVEIENENGVFYRFILKEVLVVPEYDTNLLSLSKMNEKGHTAEFSPVSSQLKTKGGVSYNIVKQGNLYTVPLRFIEPPKFVSPQRKFQSS